MLHRVKDILTSCTVLSVKWIRVAHRELVGERTRTLALNCQKGYSTRYHVKKNVKLRDLVSESAAATELFGHWSAGSEQLCCAQFIFKYTQLSLILFSFPLPFPS